MITNEQIAELKALEAAATPGPWSRVDQPWGDGQWVSTGTGDPNGRQMVCEWDTPVLEDDRGQELSEAEVERNMALIAASRNALPDLLTELERLRAAVDAAGGLCSCGHVKADHGQYENWCNGDRATDTVCHCKFFRPATQPGEGEGR